LVQPLTRHVAPSPDRTRMPLRLNW
jgi:hypothetical protein